MIARTAARVAMLAALGACLAGCGTAPVPLTDPPRHLPVREHDPLLDFETRTLTRAAALERQGRLAEAAFAWQALMLLRPEHGEHLAALNKRIQTLAAERLQRARQAQMQGNTAAAEAGFLGVLAVQPGHAEAAASLRSIERARMQRVLGQPSRVVLTRRFSTAPNIKPAAADALELEHVAMLAGQGDVDDAIGILERRFAAQPRDDATRRLLATLLFKRAQALQTSDPPAARASLARCLRLEPGHADAAALLEQLNPPVTKASGASPSEAPPGADPR